MPPSLSAIVEQQIKKAIAEGQLDHLEGAGKPLPDRSSRAHVDAAMLVAGRLMAESGALPEEFEIKKRLDAARVAYGRARTGPERRVAMALVADLELRYDIAVEARRRFFR